MPATGSHRRRVVVAAGLVVVLASAGCGRGGDPAGPDPPSSDPPSSDHAGSGPAGPDPAATAPPARPGSPQAQPVGAPVFPGTPQEYAETTVAAFAAPDLMRLAQLATDRVRDTLVELPGPPDPTWTFVRCAVNVTDGRPTAPASSDCAFYNPDGDYLVLTVGHRWLGGPQAASRVAYEATPYPDAGAVAYLEAFVAAWRDGNRARMAALAVPEAVDRFTALVGDPVRSPTPSEVGYERLGSPATGVEVRVTVAGTAVRARVSISLLGAPQAIRSATADDPAPAG